MTGRAAEPFGIVNLQQLFVRMAGERLLAAHRRRRQHDWLARAQVARLAAVDQVDFLDVNLADARVEVFERALDRRDRRRTGIGDAVGEIFVAGGARL